MKILILGASVFCDDKLIKSDIFISEGKIAKIGKCNETADIVIEGKGLAVLPAFADIHVHLREPGYEYKEDILSGTRAAARGGFWAVACMPNTNPVCDNAVVVSYILKKAEAQPVKVLPIGAITKGLQGQELAEMGFMKQAGAVGVSDDGNPVSSGRLMKNALEYAHNFDLRIISHCEDKSLSQEGFANEGQNATTAGLKAQSRVAEEGMVARDILLSESTNCPVHIAHISTKNSVNLIRDAKKRGAKVTCETAPHYLCKTDSSLLDYNQNAKINPPLRTDSDVLALIEGLRDGTIDCIATDHAPHHIDDKNVELELASSGTIGLETCFAVCYTHLVKTGKIKLFKLISLLCTNPCKFLGLKEPKIMEGAAANLTLVDLDKEFVVTNDTFAGKSRNSIFLGDKLFGDVKCTIINGQIAYKEQK